MPEKTQNKKDRLPPGQRETSGFPVLQKDKVYHVDRASYMLKIYGEVKNPRSFSLPELEHMIEPERIVDIHCVTSWSKFDTKWAGISFITLFKLVEPTPDAHFLEFYCADGGFTTTVPITACEDPNTMIALRYDGQPVSDAHGGPVRTLFPKLYFYKSAKWLTEIRVLKEDRLGYWEQGGYSNKADPWKNQRYTSDDEN